VTEAEWIAFLQRPEIPAFNRAMLVNPDDDLPRLVFADWMDETCPDTAVNAAVRRSVTHPDEREQWVSVQPLGMAMAFVRGRLRVSIQEAVPPPSNPSPRTPLEAVWRSNWVGNIAFGYFPRHEVLTQWAIDPGMATVQGVEFHDVRSGEHLRTLLESSELTALTSLEVQSGRDGGVMVQVLTESEVLPRLRALACGGHDFGGDRLQLLWSSSRVQELKDLALRWVPFSTATVVSMANSPHLRGLERLQISGHEVNSVGAAALANSPYLCEAIRAQWRR
jgi:uncharacterized protein (TIGR02996 family)